MVIPQVCSIVSYTGLCELQGTQRHGHMCGGLGIELQSSSAKVGLQFLLLTVAWFFFEKVVAHQVCHRVKRFQLSGARVRGEGEKKGCLVPEHCGKFNANDYEIVGTHLVDWLWRAGLPLFSGSLSLIS